MSTYESWKERRDLDKLEAMASRRLLWVDRPLLVHEARPDGVGEMCDCGCNSPRAFVAERRQHLQTLINPISSVRRLRARVEDKARFDDLAARAKRVWLPRRVMRQHLPAVDCDASILALFGGIRGAKTTFAADEGIDDWCRYGGRGAQIWWVAPTRDKNQIALNKLALGELIGKEENRRRVDPMLPVDLLRYVPSSPRAERCYIELVDGTRWWFKYASRDGGNLKGEAPIVILGDEWAEVADIGNYRQALDRKAESNGRLVISTTPKQGSFLKERVYDAGQRVEDWDGKHPIAFVESTGFDNPWVSDEYMHNLVAEYGDDEQAIKREIFGQWVGDGLRLWEHFDEDRHVVRNNSGRRVTEWGLVNVTRFAVRRFFRGREQVHTYGGVDFDINPMSFAAIEIGCPKGLNESDPKNWIFCQIGEVVERCQTVHKFADRLKEEGYSGLCLSVDPSGAQDSPYRQAHGVDSSSTHRRELERAGFTAKPANISDSGNPRAPPVLDRIDVFHKLMREEVVDRDGHRWPRFLIDESCVRTIDSLRTQESDEYGKPRKEPGTVSDRRSGPIDSMTYGGWVVFSREYYRGARLIR